MSGFEYALGELMIAEGMVEEGMTLIRAIRARSDGKKRNPFNEIECGSNYARAMASWGVIPILSGFTYDMTQGRIGFAPVTEARPFRSVWSCAEAWGTVEITDTELTLCVTEGKLNLRRVDIDGAERVKEVVCDGKSVAFRAENGGVCWDEMTVGERLVLAF